MKSKHQINIENYHSTIEKMHPGHNMHIMHRDWHMNNQQPPRPGEQDPKWGVKSDFGTNFLQMHHEMLKAKSTDPHSHMKHASVTEWYADQGISLPAIWNPLDVIPEELGYDPDLSVYPDEIRKALRNGKTSLTRTTDKPNFELPKYFTREGTSDPTDVDLFTGARKLSDFVNTNQLGCSLVDQHNEWHGKVGGAMSRIDTAIADPIFYFGVHWYVDKVFDEFKLIEKERQMPSFDFEDMSKVAFGHKTLTKEAREFTEHFSTRKAREFTKQEKAKIDDFIKASEAIRRPLQSR